MKPSYVRYYVGLAHWGLGDQDRAIKHLTQAHEQAEAFRLRRVLWRIYAALNKIEVRRGNQAEADVWRNKAREVIDYIADHAGSDVLRQSFLNVPEVASALRNES